MELRPYQRDCIDSIKEYLFECSGHPVVSLPTGAGKTVIFSYMLKEFMEQYPGTRACILAHRQELIAQAEQKMLAVWPTAPISVYSAGLKRRETQGDILIAGIQSVYRKASLFDRFNLVIVDEAHLIPRSKETMYRRFLSGLLEMNQRIRMVGFTATPYRMSGGNIYGKNQMFNDLIYEADMLDMIDKGYICNLSTKGTKNKMDVSGITRRGGEFVQAELDSKFCKDQALIIDSVDEIIRWADDRKSWLVFCCGVKHAMFTQMELQKRGIETGLITGETDKDKRRDLLERFSSGAIRCLVNVNCLTTGLDVERIDLIAMMRPTESASLWVQSVGRGLRKHPDKQDCLVLDFGQNALRHGPINRIRVIQKSLEAKKTSPCKECPECHEMIHSALRECPECGYVYPEREAKHDVLASTAPIISRPVDEWVNVDGVRIMRHSKSGKPDSVRVRYLSGIRSFDEWLCLSHGGYATMKSKQWLAERGLDSDSTVDSILSEENREAFQDNIRSITRRIKIRLEGKYERIVDADIEFGVPA